MHPTTTASPRPFSTYYYGPNARISEWSRIGHASTLRGAIRAATMRLFDGTCVKAVVYNEDRLEVAYLTRTSTGIRIVGVFDAPR